MIAPTHRTTLPEHHPLIAQTLPITPARRQSRRRRKIVHVPPALAFLALQATPLQLHPSPG